MHDGADRWAAVAAGGWRDDAARARAAFDLAIVSVLLDAGAGPAWRFRDPAAGGAVGRSEGLALASLAMFVSGAFSGRAGDPLRADADALETLADETLAAGFQASETNPLAGIAGRADLLRRLGRTVAAAPKIFATRDAPRPGGLFDHLAALADHRPDRSPDHPARASPPSRADLAVANRRWAGSPSATAGGIPRSAATIRPMGWCRSTSSPNGSPIR